MDYSRNEEEKKALLTHTWDYLKDVCKECKIKYEDVVTHVIKCHPPGAKDVAEKTPPSNH